MFSRLICSKVGRLSSLVGRNVANQRVASLYNVNHRSISVSTNRWADDKSKPKGPKGPLKYESVETDETFVDDTDILASMKRQALREEAERRRGDNSESGNEQSEADKEYIKMQKLKQQQQAEEDKVVAKSMRNFGFTIAACVLVSCLYLGYPSEEDLKKGDNFITGYPNRIYNNLKNAKKTVNEPQTTKLLPDPLPAPYAHPLTLCIELQDSLLHMDWDKTRGWAIQTRPGVRQFLSSLGRYFEVVVFTTQPAWLADQVCQSFDPMFFYTMYRLYRDHTTKVGSVYVKNLDHLNRNVGKTVIVDIDPESYQLQPDNGLKLKKWMGEKDDRELKRFEIFLGELATMVMDFGIKDIRPIIHSINQLDAEDPIEGWRKYKDQKREAFEQELLIQYPDPKPNALMKLLSYVGVQLQAKRPMNAIDYVERQANIAHEQFLRDLPQQKANLKKIQEEQQAMIKKHIEDNKEKGLKLWDYMNGSALPEAQQQQQK